jgi:hypothetical protein
MISSVRGEGDALSWRPDTLRGHRYSADEQQPPYRDTDVVGDVAQALLTAVAVRSGPSDA